MADPFGILGTEQVFLPSIEVEPPESDFELDPGIPIKEEEDVDDVTAQATDLIAKPIILSSDPSLASNSVVVIPDPDPPLLLITNPRTLICDDIQTPIRTRKSTRSLPPKEVQFESCQETKRTKITKRVNECEVNRVNKTNTPVVKEAGKNINCAKCNKIVQFIHFPTHWTRCDKKPSKTTEEEKDLTTCEMCGTITFLVDKEEHLKSHEVEPENRHGFVDCQICGKWFKQMVLEHHLRIKHSGKCEECGVLESSNTLDSHMSSFHSNPARHLRPLSHFCKTCKIWILTVLYGQHLLLKNHPADPDAYKSREIETTRQYEGLTCAPCNKTFASNSYLKGHMERVHGEKPFMCEVCGKRFNTRASCNTHSRTAHSDGPKKKKMCSVCGVSVINLKIHMYIHTGEKPISCPYCEKKFRESATLYWHLKTHKEAYNHKCRLCSKTFKYETTLKTHLFNIHSIAECGMQEYLKKADNDQTSTG